MTQPMKNVQNGAVLNMVIETTSGTIAVPKVKVIKLIRPRADLATRIFL